MFFVKNRKILYLLIALISLVSVGAILFWGLRFGTEFTGGTMIEVAYTTERPEKTVIEPRLNELNYGGYSLRRSGDDGYLLRIREISDDEYDAIKGALTPPEYNIIEKRRSFVGPSIGEELKNKAFAAIAVVSVLIIIYIAFAFRNVRSDEDEEENAPGVSSWTYGFIAIFVLIHDLLVPIGMFAVLGKFAGAEVDVLIVMALLTILGYSVNDTIIIFDRVRENLIKNANEEIDEPYSETVGKSLSQTYARSINTSLTTLMVVVSLLIFGGSTTTYFALTLATGVFAGAYSSLALAAPLLVTLEERKNRKFEKAQANTGKKGSKS